MSRAVTPCPCAVTPCPAGHCLRPQQLPLGTIIVLGSQKAQPSLAPPVPHAGCIFRSLSALVKTEGISVSLALPSPVSLERSQAEPSPRRVWNGSAGQLGMPVRQPALLPPCSLPFFEVRSSSAFLLLLPPSPHSPPAHTKHPDLSWALSLIPGILYIGINRLVTVGELGGRGYIYLSC